jgi:hypothetical protein
VPETFAKAREKMIATLNTVLEVLDDRGQRPWRNGRRVRVCWCLTSKANLLLAASLRLTGSPADVQTRRVGWHKSPAKVSYRR